MNLPERITDRKEYIRYKQMLDLGPCGSCARCMQWINFRVLCSTPIVSWVSGSDCVNNSYIFHVEDI